MVYVTPGCFVHPKCRAFWPGGVSGGGQLSEGRRAQGQGMVARARLRSQALPRCAPGTLLNKLNVVQPKKQLFELFIRWKDRDSIVMTYGGATKGGAV